MKWTMRNGQQIDVDDMDDNHIKNTINMLRRNIGDRDILKLIIFAKQSIQDEQTNSHNHQVKLNGDMAQEFNNTQDSLDYDDYYETIY
jgi:hypothetical protein